MDEQMISKRNEQCTKSVRLEQWIGKRRNRLSGLLQLAKTAVTPIRPRTA